MRRAGFTLIETVLVLAIAGLLLVIIFAALSQTQKARRDSQRKEALGEIASYLDDWASLHNGQYPPLTQVDDPYSDFRTSFNTSFDDKVQLKDPLTAKHYYIQTVFPACDPSQAGDSDTGGGPGFISVAYPGANGNPYKIRICLEQGEYWIGN